MPDHRLAPGLQVIEQLVALGQALGYRAEREVALFADSGEAVDVAWFATTAEGGSPLFIFEVESSATNTSEANAVKVLGSDNRDFAKPLFFFHVYVSGGERSHRVTNLQRSFGTHNYRVYRLALGETAALLRDVLAQHRRLTDKIDAPALCEHLARWPGVDADEILNFAEHEGFGRATDEWLATYGSLAVAGQSRYRRRFERYLLNAFSGDRPPQLRARYGTYLGNVWATPIHIAICAGADPGGGSRYLGMLRWWQEKSSFMPMIGPFFGLSSEYDAFIAQVAPALLALIAGVMRRVEAAVEYVGDQLQKLVESDVSEQYWMFAAFWGLVVSSAKPTTDSFDRLRASVAARGGLPAESPEGGAGIRTVA